MERDYNYHRRHSWSVDVGGIPLGGENPIRIQSMTSTSTDDIEASRAQAERIADAGASYVRLTTQGVKEADAIGKIRTLMRADGYTTPLVADIHFNPAAAFAAAAVTDKVRINPGNFVDPARTFKKLEYTDAEYAAEIERIGNALRPFIDICRQHGTAVRIGVNHGSLSDRIMSRYGDTPAGMVESAMEFLRVFVAENYLKVVISIKASNTVVMVATVRLLVEAMEKENMHFPLHLGVTEAGDGEDGRIKSAVGIGTLLVEGIGDTIRVSLSEDPECEVPVAEFLAKYVENFGNLEPAPVALDGVSGKKCRLVGNKPIVVARKSDGMTSHPDFVLSTDGSLHETITTIVPFDLWKPGNGSQPLFTTENYAYAAGCNAPIKWLIADAESFSPDMRISSDTAIILSVPAKYNRPAMLQSVMSNLLARGNDAPVVLHCDYSAASDMEVQVMASVDMGSCLMNGFGAGIMLDAPIDADKLVAWCFGILQAARLRTTKTEYISCPSCGRTLFDLQTTVKRVKEATSHLTHLKIGIMGCIVNGPGEMADADYGYVGAAAGKISLYKGKQCIERNIPQEEAIPHLIALIKANNDWIEP
ncbi:MAG: (E)-4-hydroxy-3-methylbut-2-enyl-diphosphate synthase [Bacteroidales bacterium]|nr:(E)-4-hydroxy-3-methylbut-2-enyl-diphosphate synthase [Bacteroidales bacterium]